MADRIADLTLPNAGMNTDTSASQLDQNESPELYNVIVSEPGQIRPRKGFRRRWVSTAEGAPVRSVITHGNAMIVSAKASDGTISPFHLSGEGAAVPTGLSVGFGTASGHASMLIPSATGTWVSHPSTAVSRAPSVSYERAAFFIQEPASGYATHLYAWNGRPALELNTTAALANLDQNTASSATPQNLRAGTFGAVPTYNGQNISLKGYFVRWPGLDNINYQIVAHTAGQQTFTLDKPYGLSQSTAEPLNPQKTPLGQNSVVVSSLSRVMNAPERAAVVGVHLDRLFLGRGVLKVDTPPTMQGEYPNIIFWSDPGQPELWPGTNFLVLDDEFDEAITAFGYAGGKLVIFKRTKTYVLLGDSNETFAPKLVSQNVGCIDPYSVCEWRGMCIFASEQGIYGFDGAQLQDLSQPRVGHGVRSVLLPLLRRDDGLGDKYMHRQVACGVVGDYLLVSVQDTRAASAPVDMFMCHLPSRAWVRWGNSAWPMAFYRFIQSDGTLWREAHGVGMTQATGQNKPARTFSAALDNVMGPEIPLSVPDRFDEVPGYISIVPNGSPTLALSALIARYLP